jgi:hypothetical protein
MQVDLAAERRSLGNGNKIDHRDLEDSEGLGLAALDVDRSERNFRGEVLNAVNEDWCENPSCIDQR